VFSRYVLRTIDLEGARRFYERALGLALPEGAAAETSLEAWPLHERARAAGAPPHWLGHLEVDDVERAVAAMVARGGQPLAPRVRAPGGAEWVTIRDASGAVVALRARAEPPPDRPVAWHQLHARDLEPAWSAYAELAGWIDAGTIDAPDLEGGHRLFAWSEGAVGSVGGTARWPGVHPHWLFYFPVDDIGAVAARVRAEGGTALAPTAGFEGRRVAACEDAQGAAFGVIER
jgi:predicted enzyme related to lactoylglutathione lyase